MASRSDQLQSHQFTLQRVVGALAMRDPNPVSSPLRRVGGALFASVMVAVLALAAVGVYGLLRPGTDPSWREGSSIIVEQETAARFIYRDGVLHPVLNYSSALLLLGSATPRRVSVSRTALSGVPRGAPLGIAGAPDLLPIAADLVRDPWTLCSRPAASGPESVLFVGSTAPGPVASLGGRAVVVADPTGHLHLIWNNRRHLIKDPDLVLAAFVYPRQTASPIAASVLNAVPAGLDLGRVAVERSGKPSAVPGFGVGQVFVVKNQSGGELFGVVRESGLSEITPVQADLLIADGANGPGGKAREMGQALYASAPRAAPLVPTGDLAPPASVPELARPAPQGGLCATFAPGVAAPEIGLAASAPRADGEVRTPGADVPVPGAGLPGAGLPGARLDAMFVPPGRGAVVESLAAATSPNGALALVSDLGVCFPVPSREVLKLLGYADVAPQRLPAALVALLPAGSALDPGAAGQPTR